jgi:hypothetical protein
MRDLCFMDTPAILLRLGFIAHTRKLTVSFSVPQGIGRNKFYGPRPGRSYKSGGADSSPAVFLFTRVFSPQTASGAFIHHN